MKWLILFILTVAAAVVYMRYSKEESPNPAAASAPALNPEGTQGAIPGQPSEGGIRPTPMPPSNPQIPTGPQNNNANLNPNPLPIPPQASPPNFNGFPNGLPEQVNPEPPFEPPPPPPQYFPENEGFNAVNPSDAPSPFEPPPMPDSGDNSNGFVPPPPPPPMEDGEF